MTVGGFLLREVVADRFVGFVFLLMAIRPSWYLTTASSAATDTSPDKERGRRRGVIGPLDPCEPMHQRNRVMKASGLID